uniref:ATP synthase F0 subunit 8 n=1 Tax=Pachypsylla venusta TaxID=38123 RepID=Q69HD4_PACVE|nr:ATP synthase F0 subunit 8 [Pachypsylla venusta]
MPWLMIFFNIITLMMLISSFIYFFIMPQIMSNKTYVSKKTYPIKW